VTEQFHQDSAAVTMTAAEFAIARESLGVSEQWLADYLATSLRTVQRWGKGQSRLSDSASDQVVDLLDQTDDFIEAVVSQLRADPIPDEHGEQWVTTYPTDTAYRQHHPDTEWPASWHRAAMGRVVERVDGVRVRYIGDPE
jgi:hypothetical protein